MIGLFFHPSKEELKAEDEDIIMSSDKLSGSPRLDVSLPLNNSYYRSFIVSGDTDIICGDIKDNSVSSVTDKNTQAHIL